VTGYDNLVPVIALALSGAAVLWVHVTDEPIEQAEDLRAAIRRLERSLKRAMVAQAVAIIVSIVALLKLLPGPT